MWLVTERNTGKKENETKKKEKNFKFWLRFNFDYYTQNTFFSIVAPQLSLTIRKKEKEKTKRKSL